MAAFSPDARTKHSLDWTILQDGGVSLYRNEAYLGEDLAALERIGYLAARFNCSAWETLAQMDDALAETLGFPAYYGRNFNALRDCLSDMEIPDESGTVFVLNGFDHFLKGAHEEAARGLVDIFADASRYHMLMGRRLIILVQSDDPRLRLGGLAAVDAIWNRREWLNKDRGL